MRIFSGFKRELLCIDPRICLLAVAATWFVGTLSLLLSGAGSCYCGMTLPGVAPGYVGWLILWMLHYILLGLALGAVLGHCGCHRRLIGRGVIFWAFYLLCTLIWVPLFFAIGMELTALLLIGIAVLFGLGALSVFASRSLLSAVLLLFAVLWQICCFLQTLLIILWN
ncbi:MAG: tryptophan-rich sensory protein [Clostridia bacterium]|nr:tryptophan-rich sensory protein [Clostridia bacterium]